MWWIQVRVEHPFLYSTQVILSSTYFKKHLGDTPKAVSVMTRCTSCVVHLKWNTENYKKNISLQICFPPAQLLDWFQVIGNCSNTCRIMVSLLVKHAECVCTNHLNVAFSRLNFRPEISSHTRYVIAQPNSNILEMASDLRIQV